MSTGETARVTSGKSFVGWVLAIRCLVVVAFAAAATLGLLTFAWSIDLCLALFAMAAFVAVETSVLYLWSRSSGAAVGSTSVDRNPYAEAAKVAITTEGIVLGLVAFQEGALEDTTVKVGACALVVGVLSAGLLYLSVVMGPPPDPPRRFAASLLFSLVFWCLGLGLICVLAGSWN